MSKLKPKQEVFCQEYLVDLNATQAAARAGYSAKTANEQGSRLLANASISERIQELMNARSNETKITAETVLKELLLIAKTDISNAYYKKGMLKPVHEIPEETRRAIAGIKVFEEFDWEDGKRIKIGETRELKLWNKLDALELLGRHLKLFTDKVEHSFSEGLAERMAKARNRRNG